MPTYAEEVLADVPRAWWRLLEASGTTLASSAATAGWTLNLFDAAPTLSLAGPHTSKAIRWTTANTTGRYQSATSLFNSGTVTFEAWVRIAAAPTVATVIHGVDYGGELYLDTAGRAHWSWYDQNAGAYRDLSSPAVLPFNVWHHIVGTVGSAGGFLYIDGVQVASNTSTIGYTQAQAAFFRYSPNRSGKGAYDAAELAIYYSQLSPARVKAHHDAGNPPVIRMSGGGNPRSTVRQDQSGSAAVSGGGAVRSTVRQDQSGSVAVSGGGSPRAEGDKGPQYVPPKPVPPTPAPALPDPTTAPTLTAVTGGDLEPGTYRYAYAGWRLSETLCTAPSPVAEFVLPAGKGGIRVAYTDVPGADGHLIYRQRPGDDRLYAVDDRTYPEGV